MPQRLEIELLLSGGRKVRTEINLTEKEIRQLQAAGMELDASMNRLSTKSLPGTAAASGKAGQVLFELGAAAEDAQFGMRGVQNNIPVLIQGFARLAKEQGGAANGFRALLGAATTLGGAAGLVALGLTIANLTGLTDKLGEVFSGIVARFRDTQEEAALTADEIRAITDEVIRLQRNSTITFEIPDDQLDQAEASFQRQLELAEQTVLVLSRLKFDGLLEDESKLAEFRGDVAALEQKLAEIAQRRAEITREERDAQLAREAGIQTTEELAQAEERRAQAEQRRTDAERRARRESLAAQKLRVRNEEQVSALIGRLRIELIADARSREIAESQAKYDALEEQAQGNAEAEALIAEARAQALAEIEIRRTQEALDIERDAQARRLDIQQAYARLRGATEIELIDKLIGQRERWLEAEEYLSGAASERSQKLAAELEQLELRRAEIVQRRAEKITAIEDAAAARLESLTEERLRVEGATDAELLARRRARFSEELVALGAVASQTEEQYARQLELENLLFQAETERFELERRAYEERRRQVEGYTNSIIGAFDTARRYERRFSGEEIESRRAGFAQEEKDLAKSLRERSVTYAEYQQGLKEISAERRAFEREVEEDRKSFTVRVTKELAEVAVEEGKRQLAAFIAGQITRRATKATTEAEAVATTVASETAQTAAVTTAIATQTGAALAAMPALATATGLTMAGIAAAAATPAALTSIATFGGSAAAGQAAVLQALATVNAAAAAPNLAVFLEEGGFVGAEGQRGRDAIPAMLGAGEAVLNWHQQAYVQRALVNEYGFGLKGLFEKVDTPHYLNSGGFAGGSVLPRLRPDVGALIGGGSVEVDLEPLRKEVRELRAELERRDGAIQQSAQSAERASRAAQDAKSNPAPVTISRNDSGRIRRLGEEYTRGNVQRLGRPNTRPKNGRPPRE